MPSSAIPIYNETNAFWEIKLDSSPESVLEYTKIKALENIKCAKEKHANLKEYDYAYKLYSI